MKTLIKLAIAAAMLNAAARGGMAAWTYFEFRDATQELVVFGARSTPEQLHEQIVERAVDLDVPVLPEDISVQREGARTWADVHYTQAVEFFPRFTYPVEFSFSVDGFSVG